MKRIKLLIILLIINFVAIADEGMWLPLLLKQVNEKDMQAKGMKITAEDIYSVNKSSLKDAVVIFGGGCTGEIISDKGLVLTNHHCGYSQIQARSTLEKNYLANGFWAMNMQEEIACPGLSVTFITRIEDVSTAINSKLNESMTDAERDAAIKMASVALEKEATEGTHYTASVRSFYYGNQFYLFVMETFKDVRLVGTPPNSIGKFGGDTDNWMWPRHTGDFALFRIYADKDNKPASYSAENIPYAPRHSFLISLKGVEPGDFTMVYGFPGRTMQYIPSFAVKNIIEVGNPVKINIRDKRLEIIDAAMRTNDKLRLQYSAKQASISNAWKKWQGELKGLKRLQTVSEKEKEEKAFTKWVNEQNKTQYKTLLSNYERAYKEFTPLSRTADYINEAAYGVELLKYARSLNKLSKLSEEKDEKGLKEEIQKQLNGVSGFFKDFDAGTDKKLFSAMMQLYYENVDASLHPAGLESMMKKYNGDFREFADAVYEKTHFSDSLKAREFLSSYNHKKYKQLKKDPAWKLALGFANIYSEKVEEKLVALNNEIAKLNRLYMAAQMEINPSKTFYPDANSTMRVSYGKVGGYVPADAVQYQHYTTLKGVLEKEDPAIEEFEVPEKLKELFDKKDFGNYAYKGELPVAFIASNHTTGGNSGSPVINANGELIGTNFDRVWEGTMSDIDFDPDQCRNISLDIRFTLFIIDKFAGCKRLIEEMKIIK